MNRTTLFSRTFCPPKPFDAKTERQFLCDYSGRYATRRQVVSVLALSINLAYFGIDFFNAVHDSQFRAIFTEVILPVRLSGNVIFLLSIGLLSRPLAKTSEHYASFCLALCFLSCYMMLLALTYVEPFPEHYLFYYEGMLLNVLYFCGLSRILAKSTFILICFVLLLTFLTFISAEGSMALSNLDARTDKEHNTPLSFLVIFSIVSYFIALEQERTARHTFMREQDLQQAQEAIKNSTDEVIKLEEQARLQADQQNRDKSRFIANAAHDLRNVMQPIAIFLNLSDAALQREDLKLAQDYLQQATVANQALCADINAMLDISELDAGFINIQYSRFDARELAAEVLKENLPYADERKVKLYIANNPAIKMIVNSDRHHLKRILTNLVVNAIKFKDDSKGEAATVGIFIVSHKRQVRIDVIDNGIGIPHSEQENIFNPLYQLNNPERDREAGKGLGLSIVKATLGLLDQHTLKLISKPGAGSRFSLKLPQGDGSAQMSLFPAHDWAISLSGLYILIVENDLPVKQSLMALLQNQGAEVEAVGSMTDLQQLLPNLERDPDMVISDYRLNDNFTANDVIRIVNDHFGYDLRSLILTGETADLSQELPGRPILHKPILPQQLLAEICRIAKQQD